MMTIGKPLSIGVAIREAWLGFKNNLWFYLLSFLALSVVHGLYSGYIGDLSLPELPSHKNQGLTASLLPLSSPSLQVLAFIAYIIFSLGFFLGLFRASTEVMRGGKASFAHYFRSPGDLWRGFVGYLLYFLIIFGGLILLVFPAVIWGVKYSLFPYLIADKHVGGLESLQLSSQATHGAKWDLFGGYLVIDVLWIAAILTLGLGLFIVAPLWALVKAYYYVQLTKDSA